MPVFYFVSSRPPAAPTYVTLRHRDQNSRDRELTSNAARSAELKAELCSLARAQHHEQHRLPRAVLPGCKKPFLEFERRTLERRYTAALALAPLHIAAIAAGLLCSNRVAYRFGTGMRCIAESGSDDDNLRSNTDRANQRLRVGVGRDLRCTMHAHVRVMSRALTMTESAVDEKGDSTTPHAARAGAPRESAGWCAIVARGVGAGVPAAPLRLVATKTQRAVRRRNPRAVRPRLPRAPHARLGGLRGSGIVRRGRFALGQSGDAKSARPRPHAEPSPARVHLLLLAYIVPSSLPTVKESNIPSPTDLATEWPKPQLNG
ncbi:hypothetical protein FB451DRAFT_1404675 [Mycena latifolia]|nr:hypothetical protein FB451DRAFT_1404675 [Mycena latifolia]